MWFLARNDAEKGMEHVNGKVIKKAGAKAKVKVEAAEPGRPVAVDWALSKDKWEETQKPNKVASAEGSATGSSSRDDSEDELSSSGQEDDGSGEDADEAEIAVAEDLEEDEPIKPQLPTVDIGSTLFIRNLAFETTEQELNTLLAHSPPGELADGVDFACSDRCAMLVSPLIKSPADLADLALYAFGTLRMPMRLSSKPSGFRKRQELMPCQYV